MTAVTKFTIQTVMFRLKILLHLTLFFNHSIKKQKKNSLTQHFEN
jgi:hypothetical protein